MREFDTSKDKGYWSAHGVSGRWPVFTGKSFNIWVADTGSYYGTVEPDEVLPVIQKKRLHQNTLARSAFSEFSRAWAEDPTTLPCLWPRIAFRDVARATDTRTMIAALIPGSVVLVEKAPYLLWAEGDERDEAYLLGVLCTMVLDWYARMWVELKLSYSIVNSFPIPRPGRGDPLRQRVEVIAGRLAAVDDRYTEWAAAVGVPIASVTDDATKNDLIAELDAAVALLYGLDESDLRVIYDTFHEGHDYSERREAVTAHFRRLQ